MSDRTRAVLVAVVVALAIVAAVRRGAPASARARPFSACLVTSAAALPVGSFDSLALAGLMKAETRGVEGIVIRSSSPCREIVRVTGAIPTACTVRR